MCSYTHRRNERTRFLLFVGFTDGHHLTILLWFQFVVLWESGSFLTPIRNTRLLCPLKGTGEVPWVLSPPTKWVGRQELGSVHPFVRPITTSPALFTKTRDRSCLEKRRDAVVDPPMGAGDLGVSRTQCYTRNRNDKHLSNSQIVESHCRQT